MRCLVASISGPLSVQLYCVVSVLIEVSFFVAGRVIKEIAYLVGLALIMLVFEE